MNNIDITLNNNVVRATIDGKYCGSSIIPKECNNCDGYVFVGRVSDAIKEAIDNAKKAMWPRKEDRYYYVNLFLPEMYSEGSWDGYQSEIDMKERGLIFRTKEEAVEAAKKMLEVVK